MSDNQPGPGYGSSEPNPFSREGAGTDQEPGPPAPGSTSPGSASASPAGPASTSGPTAEPTGQQAWPSYSPVPSAPESYPTNPAPSAPESYPTNNPAPYGFAQPDPGYDPVPTAPYGGGPGSPGAGQAYGPPAESYGPPADGYGQAQAYGTTPYGPVSNPYQPSYGGFSPYGVGQVQHPKATPALIWGIVSLVFGLACGLGGLAGIAAIVMGGRARREIDADPQRYSGRGMASAGFGLGIAGLVVLLGWVVLLSALGAAGELN